MRISDWSSDVCSSDLPGRRAGRTVVSVTGAELRRGLGRQEALAEAVRRHQGQVLLAAEERREHLVERLQQVGVLLAEAETAMADHRLRSEEHTSELQSLMRISYAVFCLKKQNTHY